MATAIGDGCEGVLTGRETAVTVVGVSGDLAANFDNGEWG